MSTWLVNLLTAAVGVGVLTLAHYGIVPTDIAGIVAGATIYQLGGQAYHFTTSLKGNTTTTVPTTATGTISDIPTIHTATVGGYETADHPSAKGV